MQSSHINQTRQAKVALVDLNETKGEAIISVFGRVGGAIRMRLR